MTPDSQVADSRPRRAPRWRRRAVTHVLLFGGSLGASGALFLVLGGRDTIERASLATAYVSLLLLAATLAFGPVAGLRGRRYPVTTDLRRDVGIWTAIVALVHVAAGLQVHMRGKMWEYFARAYKGAVLPRIDPFGLANYAGLAATLVIAILLATSNDYSFRRLGPKRWSRVHGSVTPLIALTAMHGAVYQILEKRSAGYVAVFAIAFLAIVTLRYTTRARQGARPSRFEQSG